MFSILRETSIQEIHETLNKIEENQISNFCNEIINHKRIYLFALGRALLAGRALIMRLMHMGFEAYVVGDLTTPSFCEGDFLIILSASGETDISLVIAEKAKKFKGDIALITSMPESRLGKMADNIVKIPSQTKDIDISAPASIHPMATTYEQSMLLLFDIAVLMIMKQKNISVDSMRKLHANLE